MPFTPRNYRSRCPAVEALREIVLSAAEGPPLPPRCEDIDYCNDSLARAYEQMDFACRQGNATVGLQRLMWSVSQLAVSLLLPEHPQYEKKTAFAVVCTI